MSSNLFTVTESGSGVGAGGFRAAGTIVCPSCSGDVKPLESARGQNCPYCGKRLHIRLWPVIRRNTNAVVAIAEQATCFFHPDKAFQACCQRCGRFVCALCDLQLGSEHVCPTCFERGRTSSATKEGNSKAEWRHRDVLYDSIAVTLGWAWILFWPVVVAALPAAIVLHIKYRKAPRAYLIPRAGWRFWMAYVGFFWLPILLAVSVGLTRYAARRP